MYGTMAAIAAVILVNWSRLITVERLSFAQDTVQHIPLHINTMLISAASFLLLCELGTRWFKRPQSKPLSIARWDQANTLVLVCLFAWWCLDLNWSLYSDWTCVQLTPFILLLSWHWWTLGHTAGSWATRWQQLLHRLRFGLAPMLVLLALIDLAEYGQHHIAWVELLGEWAEVIPSLIILLILVVCFVGMGPISVRLWGARAMPEPQQAPIKQDCHRMGVRVRAVLRWPRKQVPFYNAVAIGFVPSFRFVLFSEDLLNDLTPEEARGVLGHELGHIRHHHQILLMLWFSTFLSCVLPVWEWGLLNNAWGVPEEWLLWAQAGFILFALAIGLRIGFGWISRGCERQADLVGAELVNSPDIMSSALKRVAELSGQALDAPSWRHHSIAERIRFLTQTREDHGLIAQHHRFMFNLRSMLIFAFITALFLNVYLATQYPALDDFRKSDPLIERALIQAESGNPLPWYQYVASQDPYTRGKIAMSLLDSLEAHDYDIYYAYDNKHQLRPFATLRTVQSGFDDTLRNLIAYTHIAGTANPTEDDMNCAMSLMPGIEKAIREEPDAERNHGMRDTLGCILFVHNRPADAQPHFEKALNRIDDIIAKKYPNEENETEPDEEYILLTETRDLYQKRLQACKQTNSALPLEDRKEQPETVSEINTLLSPLNTP